ncbi:hypothetical protein A3B45_04365 [Candidatus Daviesbacteria bacterium RIFCSPLOWO2_01_FULL_39_12]|uniref:O-antigen ligase-related domain-containing protein n=1 Tax=Candidatus Daviesbacteria bacterium RIFCSPLOWO2_01_FULL_39_12 TaxID=1797785 RepID=A0A1F5KMT4_9BACT|nr:MAG: hypothetical protein A3B45_04365 [Candidatus Daviesbacteria bacterium RIFCSPLOWO2_01_FULL_39_12]
MKDILETYFDLIFKVALIVLLFATLFLFAPYTTDFYDTPKFIVLLTFSGLMLTLLTLKYTVQNKITLVRTPLDIPLILFAAVAVISTFLSSSPYVALLGNQTKVYGSLASIVVLVVFYFLLTNNLRTLNGFIFKLLLLGGAALSVLTLLSYFGIKYLPPPFNQAQNFTPTGISFSTTAILAILLPLPLIELLGSRGGEGNTWGELGIFKKIKGAALGLTSNLINSFLLLLFGTTILLTGHLSTWLGGALAVILSLVILRPSLRNFKLVYVVVPLFLVILLTTLTLIPPLGTTAKNPLYDLSRSFPREVQLDFITSWKVSVSAFRDQPFWGSGPSTYLFNFTGYKPIEFNINKFWNIRFDSAFNEYLGVLGTLGGVGLLALLSLALLFISSAAKTLSHPTSHLSLPLAISGLTFFVILAFHSGTLPFYIIGLLVLAAYFVSNLSERGHFETLNRNWGETFLRLARTSVGQSSQETIKVEALPGVLLIVAFGLTLFAFYFAGKFSLADYHHKLALAAVARNDGLAAYQELVAAEQLNPYADSYRTDLAQVNFALANAIALTKGPTQDNPQGSLTDQDRQNIQVLLQQSINEARTATTLSPRSTINWEILATLYRQIAGVAENALVFSLDSFGRAILQDPLNPNLRLNVGGTYYAIRNYDLAIRFFNDAINLKPDYANGYYNLSVALRDKGDLNSAIVAAEKVVSLVDASSSDYQLAQDYLNDLKNRVSPPKPAEPPAATTEGALQNENLPKVVDVGNPPEKIATPSAVKRPNSTPEPSPTP